MDLLSLPKDCLALILKKLPTAYSLMSAIAAHRQLAAIAKSNPDTWRPLAHQTAWRLRQRSDEGWAELYKRAHCGSSHQRLVAIGGMIPNVDEAVVDIYSFGVGTADGEWAPSNPLRRTRDAPCAASDGTRLHVIGGWDGEADCALDCGETAEFGDAGAALCWEALPELSEPRCFAAGVCDESARVWVVGGGDSLYRGARCFDSIDVLTPEGWSHKGTLFEARCGLGLALDARRSDLVVCGGYSGGIPPWYRTYPVSQASHPGRPHAESNSSRTHAASNASDPAPNPKDIPSRVVRWCSIMCAIPRG